MTSKERLLKEKQSWPSLLQTKFLLARCYSRSLIRKVTYFKAVKRFRIKEIIPRNKFYHLLESMLKLM